MKTILRTVTAIRQIVGDYNPNQVQDENMNLDLPIFTVARLNEFNRILYEDPVTRVHYVSIVYAMRKAIGLTKLGPLAFESCILCAGPALPR